jgi:hypothetical protein
MHLSPGVLLVLVFGVAVIVALKLRSHRKRTAALAAQWQAFQQHRNAGRGDLLQITRVYQRGRRGSKAHLKFLRCTGKFCFTIALRPVCKPARMGHHGQEVTDRQLMGGVMKLGKALATGVAQEQQPRVAPEEGEHPDREHVEGTLAPRAAAIEEPEEVPAAR